MNEVGTTSRRVALEVLGRVEDDGAYANLLLASTLGRSGLSEQDRGFVTDLVYGTLRHQRSLDHLVDRFLSSAPPAPARRVLRLGAYQLVHRPDVPDYAAVGETVQAAPKRYRGLVNAVLRKVATAAVAYPDEATRLSYPDWIIERLREDLGSGRADAALDAMNEPARPTVRADGYVQDQASQWVVDLVDAQPGELVLDLCAAPGGKATGLAATGATVIASDLQEQRAGLIASNVDRLGSSGVSVLVADGLAPPMRPGVADRVLLDAPCSGLGVLRRRPDARWRLDAGAVDRLAALQRRLVDAAVPLVRPGGVFVYSVCTLSRAESLDIDEHLRRSHPSMIPLPVPGLPWQEWGRGAVLLPDQASTDGMCLFRYRLDDGVESPGDESRR